MFNRMRIYTVHVKPDDKGANFRPVFIKEGFNFAAFIFTVFWALYKRLWLVAVLLMVAAVLLALLVNAHYLTRISGIGIHLGIHFIVGFHGNDWLRAKLRRKGYSLSDVTAGDSYLRAQQRYLERYVMSSCGMPQA